MPRSPRALVLRTIAVVLLMHMLYTDGGKKERTAEKKQPSNPEVDHFNIRMLTLADIIIFLLTLSLYWMFYMLLFLVALNLLMSCRHVIRCICFNLIRQAGLLWIWIHQRVHNRSLEKMIKVFL